MTALAKTWVGSTGDYSLASNWLPISIKNSTYRWTSSGGGTNEFYLELAGGGNPGLSQPANVQKDGSNLTSGTPGTLAVQRWGWADNDLLGYSTIYVRLTGGVDPDTLTTDAITFTQIPVATDNVTVPAGSGAISSGLDQSAVAIGRFKVEEGYANAIASASGSLKINCSSFSFKSTAVAYIDLGSSACSPQILGTLQPNTGYRGLYLTGTAIDTLNVLSGYVGLAWRPGEISTVDAVRCAGTSADLWLGPGVTVDTYQQFAGTGTVRCGATTAEVFGGELTTQDAGVFTNVNVVGGTLYPESTGTIGTLTQDGGTVDALASQVERAITNYRHNGGTLRYSPDTLTITNRLAPSDPVVLSASRPA